LSKEQFSKIKHTHREFVQFYRSNIPTNRASLIYSCSF